MVRSDGTVLLVSSVGCWLVSDCQRRRWGMYLGDRGAPRPLIVVPGSFSLVSSWYGMGPGVGDEVHLARTDGRVLLVISTLGMRLEVVLHGVPIVVVHTVRAV